MTKFKSKAEKAFEEKMKVLMDEVLEFGWNKRTSQNVERLFNQYGSYLELIDFSSPMSPPVARAHARLAQDLVDINVDNRELVYQRATTTTAAVTGGRATHE